MKVQIHKYFKSEKPPQDRKLRSTEPMLRQRDTQMILTKSSAMVQLSA